MTLRNVDELRTTLAETHALGRVFARHAYGMRSWVDQIGRKLDLFAEPEAKTLAARIVSDNARHMLLFRARAAALGVDPDTYRVPDEGAAIYERLEELRDPLDISAFALGSLDHFVVLLGVYREAADPYSATVIDEVAADVNEARRRLRERLDGGGEDLRSEAERMYEVRELAETATYGG